MHNRVRWLWLLPVLLLSACQQDPLEPVVLEPGPAIEPPVALATDLTAIPISEWMYATLPNGANDPILDSIRAGTFTLPAVGPDGTGLFWGRAETGDNGSLGAYPGSALVYFVAQVDLPTATRIVARADRAAALFVNGVQQPADLYGSGRMRVPFAVDAGPALIVVRGLGGFNEVRAELFTTPDELWLNLQDLTRPDLPVGNASESYVGVPILNLTGAPVFDLNARVIGSPDFEDTTVVYPALPGGAVTQIGFVLRPRLPFPVPDRIKRVRIRVWSATTDWSYERELELPTVAADVAYRRTFRSPVDGSIQYYGVVPPADFDPDADYGLVLTLHGAGVEGIGQARAYSAKDWAYIIAPTNRRPFGFDWEEWGRLNGLMALEHATASFNIDPSRVYLTGHSMGGHGTWHLGVMHPGRFAVVGPSAGWGSFYSYIGVAMPTGAFAPARAHSDTLVYIGNLAHRAAYVIHGSADDNVPVSEGLAMFAAVSAVTVDATYHEEPGAGHWWDGDASPGADCVDWPPLFNLMEARTLDPTEVDFDFRSPSPAYSATHSFVTLHSAVTPYEDLLVSSVSDPADPTLEITTTNVRSMELDGAALKARGVDQVVVNGVALTVTDGAIFVGPTDGKRRDVHGPFNQVFHRPFCYVYTEEEPEYAEYAAFLTSYWSIYGNGHACALPVSALTDAIRADYNLVYLGVPMSDIPKLDLPIDWSGGAIEVDGTSYDNAGLMFVFPEGNRLSALLVTAPGAEHELYTVVPFSSRGGLPDYLVWADGSALGAGFFDPEWGWDPDL